MLFLRNLFRRFPASQPDGRYGKLKIAVIADELTTTSLSLECSIRAVTLRNHVDVLKNWRPDLLFVESAWQGYKGAWKYQLASYPDVPERNNYNLKIVLNYAAKLGIPSVFWNKEDGIHYERFINTAKLFQNIFTVDENCIDRYKNDVDGYVNVDTLMFPVQPRLHHLQIEQKKIKGFACFLGSYGTHIHPNRRIWQNMLFDAVAPFGLNIYDRNHRRKASFYRYPTISGMSVYDGVPYHKTADLYRQYKVCLNVNTIENSRTMYSRRLIEILAVGGIAISSPSLAASRLFSDYCYIINSTQQIDQAIEIIRSEKCSVSIERAYSGAENISQNHTWANRISDIESKNIF